MAANLLTSDWPLALALSYANRMPASISRNYDDHRHQLYQSRRRSKN